MEDKGDEWGREEVHENFFPWVNSVRRENEHKMVLLAFSSKMHLIHYSVPLAGGTL